MKFGFLISLITVVMTNLAFGQTDYFMSNSKTSDCKGNFFDSDANKVRSGEYDHNEDYIFTICIPGASEVSLTFKKFCTEAIEDYLVFYQGSDTNAKKLTGKVSGSVNPGTITSKDSCLTIYFHTDKSVSCTGWEAYWTTKIAPLKAPIFVKPPAVSCSDNAISFKLDSKCNCDSVTASNFSLAGPVSTSVSGVTLINCDANNETDSFKLSLNNNLDKGGSYTLNFDITKYDVCDSAWSLSSKVLFSITDCPIDVIIQATPDTLCLGECTDISAVVTGGDSTKYIFLWDNGITGIYGPNTYCPTTSSWVKLKVSDGVSIPGTDSVYITVLSPPKTMPDTSVCRTNAAFKVRASPIGGYWSGKGITNINTGVFSPTMAGAGLDTVVYYLGDCTDTLIIDVKNIDAGLPNAACPNSSPFMVYNFSPIGGVWSGVDITSTGVYTPKNAGSYSVTYTWNGCTDIKIINIDSVIVPSFDTTCLSTTSALLRASPKGGKWSGKGITNTLDTMFYPPVSKAGTHILIYNANGCKDTLEMHVININARWNEVACPDEDSFLVVKATPSGGFWSGIGITDSLTGMYDPSFVKKIGNSYFNDTLTYSINGCTDRKIMYIRYTRLYRDTVKFCIEDLRIYLNWKTVKRTPGGGKWIGSGINGHYFEPRTASYGFHQIKYTANNCTDSIIMVIYPKVNIQKDTSFCITDAPFKLFNESAKGFWKGLGIMDTIRGIFSPKDAGIGIHTIYYFTQFGCSDSVSINVLARPIAKISGTLPFYCMVNQIFNLTSTPAGGSWAGNGLSGNQFNPWNVGTGSHKVYYTFGTPTCFSVDSANLHVLDTLKTAIAIDDDSLCKGEKAILSINGNGGLASSYIFTWSTGEVGTNSILVNPLVTTNYSVTLTDGCSEPSTSMQKVNVYPKVHVGVTTSPIQCYGQQGFAELIANSMDKHNFTWHSSPPVLGNRIVASVANSYSFTVINERTKCSLDSSVVIPGYSVINAHFLTSPRKGVCLNPFEPTVSVINESTGGVKGIWSFGDGTSMAYDPFFNPLHTYEADSSSYMINLVIENEGGCKDSASIPICLDDSVYLYVPTAFSPGQFSEGLNDFYEIRTAGVTEFELLIFNRWGEMVFSTQDKNFKWDGKYQNKLLQSGVYGYSIKYKGKSTHFLQLKGVLTIL